MPYNDPPHLAIVGATGAVGCELLSILEARDVPFESLRLLASERSAGRTMTVRGSELTIEPLTEEAFDGVDVAIFSAGGSVSRTYAPQAVQRGATVIDNSSAFRMANDVPLIVPEINGEVLDAFEPPGIIANPNCSTIIALVAVTPLYRAAGIERMVMSTYQAASGAGASVMEELKQQATDFAAGRPMTQDVIGRQYLFNLFSHDSPIGPDGLNEEERKLIRETHKIWRDDSPRITATCVRVPVLRAHCESINLTFREPLSEQQVRQILAEAPGVTIVDDREANQFPEPVHASGRDDVLVGRIRADQSQPPGMGIDLFIAGDQLRKGAALNAIQILQQLCVSARAAKRGSETSKRQNV